MADIYYNRFTPSIGTPENCALSVIGTPGSTSYEYQVAAYNWNGETIPCALLTTTTGNAALSVTNYNRLHWASVAGAFGYVIYGRIAGVTYLELFRAASTDVAFTEVAGIFSWNDQGQNTPIPATQPVTVDGTGRQEWDRVLFRANKSLQSAELNEIQAINDYYMDNFGKAFFREGSVVKGCSPSVQGDLHTVIIDDGEVYIAGKVRYVQGTTAPHLWINLTGAQIIGLLVTEVVTAPDPIDAEVEDTALFDPAVGAYNYGKASAHRKSYIFTWVVDNANAIKVFDVNNGAIIVSSSDTDYAQLNKMLATRTFEESGNYVVNSTVVLVREHETSPATKLAVSVDALRAYVQGYRIERTKGAILDLNKARDTKSVGDTDAEEQFNKNSTTYIYELANNFVADVSSLDANMAGGPDNITKGLIGGLDEIVPSGLVDILTVIGPGPTNYLVDVDWVRNGNSIDWSPGGSEPTTGSSYNVTYTYRKQLTAGTRVKTSVVNEAVVRGMSPNTADDLVGGTTYGDIINISSVSSVPYWVIAHPYTAPSQIVYNGTAYNCILGHTSSATNAPGITITASGTITKGVDDGQDLVHVDLTDIVSVVQDATTYYKNVDWQIVGNNIDWSLSGAEPVLGTTYSVTYTYNGGAAYWTTSGATGVNYVEEVDWYKVDGQENNRIDMGQVNWDLGGSEPAGGVTYYVTYTYWNHATEGDFICSSSYDSYPDIGIYGPKDLRDSIDLRHPVGWSGDAPVDGNINVAYTYYMTRRDLLVVSTKGEIFIIEGISDVHPARPKVKEDTMAICELRVQAYTYGSGNVMVTMLETRRSTMEDIKIIEKRVNNIEYYQALDLLEKDAIDQYTIDSKSGVLVDNFKGSSRADIGFNRVGITFGVAFDTGRECIQVRSKINNIDLENVISSTSTVQKTGKMITLPYYVTIGETQPFASQMKNVTPYLVFPWKGNLALDPREDYWVDTTVAPDLRVTTGPTADELSFWTSKDPWQISATPWEEHIVGVSRTSKGMNWYGNNWQSPGWQHPGLHRSDGWSNGHETIIETSGYNERKVTQVSYSAETQTKDMGDRIIDTTIAPYIRSKIITVTGSKLRPAVEIGLKMDDKVMFMVPIAPTVAGAHSGCVMTDVTGKFTARFTIPANTFNTGERSITAYNYNAEPDDDTGASAVYNAFGIGQTRQKTYLSASYIQPKENVISELEGFGRATKEVVPVVPEIASAFSGFSGADPLCQSFMYGVSFFLKEVGLFFASKDTTLPITVQIRTMENGYPAPGILGTVDVYPGSINVSATAAIETRVSFPEPIFIEASKWYALVIMADVTTYNMWIATMGGIDVTTGMMITKQPHKGVLFTSSNNVTWVADPNSDIKFNMYYCLFPSMTGDLILNSQTVNASILSLVSTEVLPGNITDQATALTWYLDDNPPSTYDKVMRSNETTYLKYEISHGRLKATFTTNNNLLSPVLNLERLGLLYAKYDTGTKSYITRNVDLSSNPFGTLKVIIEMNKPTNTNVRVYYSLDDGYVWIELIVDPIVYPPREVDNFWTEYQFVDEDPSAEQFRIRIDLISTTTVDTPRVRKLRAIAY